LVTFDPILQPSVELIESAGIQLDEAVHELRRYAMSIEFDDAGLRQMESRMENILATARRYRLKPEQLPERLTQAVARLEMLQSQGSGEGVEQAMHAAQATFQNQAQTLSQQRAMAARQLSQTITATMAELAMGSGVFEIVLTPLERANASGLDEVEFRVAAHVSQTPESLARVASGGELSRISLAIQAALSTVSAVPTLIFDEVDTGIGGRVAEIVGRLLEGLGQRHQVLCVTHLPQVAARGQQHLSVTKTEHAAGVNSTIQRLDEAARVEELARMLGGMIITPTTRRHAAELLNH
ncbi:MAG: DNA repair protein RecN, partial [Burkholderiales bacterium]